MRPARSTWYVFLLTLAAAGAQGAERKPSSAELEFFEKKIRPVLAKNCHKCHGPAKQTAGLRLDARKTTLKGGETGPAIVPGKPDESLLLEAVRWESFEMPPSGKLPKAAVADLEKWIELGAPWPDEKPPAATTESGAFPMQERLQHWSFQPLRDPQPPTVEESDWPAQDLDRFILAKLEKRGLHPAPPAEKAALARRLYFDLIGLPPTVAELEEFLNDDDPEAYERLVDTLLASPHFGERWGRHWLDLVRYAETHGHEFDYPIHHATAYRDYVIRELNADVPYNRFVVEHIAGDILPEPRRHPTEGFDESIIGTGFWFLGEATHAPVDVRGDEATRVDNQIDVMSKTFLGLTVACARCHDHKFDAITAKDYYALAGFLQSSRRQEALLDPHRRIAKLVERLQAAHRRLAKAARTSFAGHVADAQQITAELLAARDVVNTDRKPEDVAKEHNLNPQRLKRWSELLSSNASNRTHGPLFVWKSLLKTNDAPEALQSTIDRLALRYTQSIESAHTARKQSVVFEDFNSGTFDDWFETGHAFGARPTRSSDVDAFSEDAGPFAPGAAHSGRLGRKLQGVLRSKTFRITRPYIFYRLAGKGGRVRLIVDGYYMDEFSALLFEGHRFNVDHGDEWKWHRQDVSKYLGHTAHIELIDHSEGYVAVDEIRFSESGGMPEPPSAAAGRLLESLTARTEPLTLERIAKRIADHVASAASRWANGAPGRGMRRCCIGLQNGLLTDDATLDALNKAIADVRMIDGATPAPMKVLAIADGTGENERLHIRGSHKNLGEKVPRRMLVAIAGEDQPPIEMGSGRLELARRMVDPENPFISRTIVNRLWHHLIGRGIVASVDNFGKLGTEPTHPELLDFLARRFIEEGWSIKTAIKSIVMSRTYRMSSRPSDPEAEAADPTNALWHRMPIRRLEAEAIRDAMLRASGRLDAKMFGPSVDVHLTPFMTGRGRPKSGPLDGAGRRSLYTSVKRNFLSPMLLAFDAPIPFSTVGRRTVSNVPAQALILMNDAFVIQQSEVWAKRMLAEPDVERRIERMYLAAFSRKPSAEEYRDARAFLEVQAAEYKIPKERIADDVRVWKDLCHVLFNVKEFIYVN